MTPDATAINRIERAGILVNADYLPLLENSGLADFERIYHFRGGTAVKQIDQRSVTRIELSHDHEPIVLYLKRHVGARLSLGELVGHWFAGRPGSPGLAEFENICAFRNSGLPTVVPVAAGEKRTGLFRYESFLITKNVEPYMSLETIIRQHSHLLDGPDGNRRKKHWIESIARMARIMHSNGFNHRDFNATHVLIGPEDTDEKSPLALFDLQRVDRKKWMRYHWMIKTLAELNYSMPAPLFDRADRWRLYLAYRGKKKERSLWDRVRFFLIMRKTRRIERHTEKIMRRRGGTAGG